MHASERTRASVDAATGAAAGTLAVVGLLELALSARDESLVDRLGTIAVERTPLPLIELGIRLVGTSDKPLLRAGAVTGLTGVGALAGVALRARPLPPRGSAALVTLGLGALTVARRSLARRRPQTRPELGVVDEPAAPAVDGGESWSGAAPLTTPVEDFYVTDVAMRPPVLDVADWRLEIEDATGASARLDATDLARLPRHERDALLACVHNRPGWDRLGQQRWVGVPVPDLLEHAGLDVPAVDAPLDLVMQGADGLVMTLPWRRVVEGRSWLVTGMGGRPLTAAHGHPARVMTPGVVGQYNGVKWVERLALAPAGSVTATWVGRGWPRETVVVPPMARIDAPGSVGMPPRLWQRPARVGPQPTVTGTAWAPAHGGVGAVELRLDEGPWLATELAEDRGPDSWRRWRLDLDVPAGRHELTVRCVAADGTTQSGAGRPPFPHGADGYHRVRVVVGNGRSGSGANG